MKKKRNKIFTIIIISLIVLVGIVWYLSTLNFEVLNPKGTIALQERNLIYLALLLSLIVVIPVFSLLIIFAYKYRENNHKKVDYKPDWDKNNLLEFSWWFFSSCFNCYFGCNYLEYFS